MLTQRTTWPTAGPFAAANCLPLARRCPTVRLRPCVSPAVPARAPSQLLIKAAPPVNRSGLALTGLGPRAGCFDASEVVCRRPVACASATSQPAATSGSFPASPSLLPYWRTHISRKPTLLQSLYECLAHVRSQGPMPEHIDVAMVYVSSAYEEDYGRLVGALRQELPGLRNVFGCTGFGIIGVDEEEGAQEVEARPALSLTLGALPQAEVVVRHVEVPTLPDGDAAPDRWSALLGVPAFPEAPLSFVVLSDPAFPGIQDLLAGLDFAFPTANKIGGLSSAAAPFGGAATATFCWSAGPPAATSLGTPPAGLGGAGAAEAGGPGSSDAGDGASASSRDGDGDGDGVRRRGASVMAIHGEVHMDLMVAQGCRPLTRTTWTVDRVAAGDPTRILTLSSESVAKGRSLPALEAFQIELQSVLSGMSEVQLRRTVANLAVGVAPEGLKQNLEPQDFLIRALRGFDAEQCLVVGDYMRAGQRVRFMVRDRQGAQEDLASHGLAYKRKQLQAMLEGGAEQLPPPFGMLMFTCNGRGSGLYGETSYDARTMSSYVPVPCAGFQCNGEIGRVGNTTHLHGFTCAVGVLRTTSQVLPFAAGAAPVAAQAGSGGSPPSAVPQAPAPLEQQQQEQRTADE